MTGLSEVLKKQKVGNFFEFGFLFLSVSLNTICVKKTEEWYSFSFSFFGTLTCLLHVK